MGAARTDVDDAAQELASRTLVSSHTNEVPTGMLPSVPVSFRLEVSASVGDVKEVIAFTINVAEEPLPPAKPTVAAAGPSSLKVTWKPPAIDNNSAVTIGYELQYKA